MSQTVYTIDDVTGIPCFSFDSTGKRLAISPNSEMIKIYQYNGSKWEVEAKLTDHNSRVYGIDWGKKTNKIVTCGSDRNAYVWTEVSKGTWKPALVLLRINRAAISVAWSPLENKFAIGTGSKLVCVCFYEERNDWWVSKHIKKPIKSSVLCVDWHPKNCILAAGSSDFTVRVYSAAIKDVDSKPDPNVWFDKPSFGNILSEFKTKHGGWVHSVRFSPDGNKLCWVSHDSTISVAEKTSSSEPFLYVLMLSNLPLLACIWTSENFIVAGGHDNKPYKFEYSSQKLTLVKCMDEGIQKEKTENISAMSKFKNLDKLAQAEGSKLTLNSIHQNSIKKFEIDPSGKIASSGLDNKIVLWTA